MLGHRREWLHRGAWILVSALIGAGLGLALKGKSDAPHAFLRDGQSVSEPTAMEASSEDLSTSQAFLLPEKPDQVAKLIRSQLPAAVERSHGGRNQRLFVLPRREGGRIRYTYPPKETIAVVPGPDGKGSLVHVRTYFRPNPLHGLITRLRRTLRI